MGLHYEISIEEATSIRRLRVFVMHQCRRTAMSILVYQIYPILIDINEHGTVSAQVEVNRDNYDADELINHPRRHHDSHRTT
jgi:hypothetical protein